MIANESVRDRTFPKTLDDISRLWFDHWYNGK